MLSFIVWVALVMWPLMLVLRCLAWESPIGQGVPHEVHEMHEWYTGFSSVLDPGVWLVLNLGEWVLYKRFLRLSLV